MGAPVPVIDPHHPPSQPLQPPSVMPCMLRGSFDVPTVECAYLNTGTPWDPQPIMAFGRVLHRFPLQRRRYWEVVLMASIHAHILSSVTCVDLSLPSFPMRSLALATCTRGLGVLSDPQAEIQALSYQNKSNLEPSTGESCKVENVSRR